MMILLGVYRSKDMISLEKFKELVPLDLSDKEAENLRDELYKFWEDIYTNLENTI